MDPVKDRWSLLDQNKPALIEQYLKAKAKGIEDVVVVVMDLNDETARRVALAIGQNAGHIENIRKSYSGKGSVPVATHYRDRTEMVTLRAITRIGEVTPLMNGPPKPGQFLALVIARGGGWASWQSPRHDEELAAFEMRHHDIAELHYRRAAETTEGNIVAVVLSTDTKLAPLRDKLTAMAIADIEALEDAVVFVTTGPHLATLATPLESMLAEPVTQGCFRAAFVHPNGMETRTIPCAYADINAIHLEVKHLCEERAVQHAREAVEKGTPDDDVAVTICDLRSEVGKQLALYSGRAEDDIRQQLDEVGGDPDVIPINSCAGPASELATCPAFKDAEEIQEALRTQTKAGTAVVVIASEGVYSWYAADFK